MAWVGDDSAVGIGVQNRLEVRLRRRLQFPGPAVL